MNCLIKKIISIVLCYFLVLSLLPLSAIVTTAATYGGSGTEADPYIVSSQAQLVSTLSTHNVKGIYIKLNNDISLSSSYVPVKLNANLDGDFHTITAKTQFFTNNYGTLKNFYYTNTVTRVNTSGSYAGIICDENYGTISGVIATGHIDNDCYHPSSGDGDITCAARAGIIAGLSSQGTIVNCAAFGSLKLDCSYGSHAGGITAYGDVTNCYASVSVSTLGGGRYGTSSNDPITLNTAINSFFEAETGVTGSVSSADMKTDSFVELLNSNPILTDSKWVRDTENKNSGYPILQYALNATISSSKTNVLLNGTEEVSFTCSDSSATIYYTLNGSIPTLTSNKYTSPLNISSTTTVTVIAYKNGVYTKPKSFLFAKILGNGTVEDPYQINSEAALCTIEELGGDDYYILTQNITLNGTLPSFGNFSGHFDGQNYEINNVYSDKLIAGLTSTNYGIIENITLRIKENNEFYARSGLADYNYGVIYNCHFKGDFNSPYLSTHCTGGIVGENYGIIEKSSFEGNFVSKGTMKGGGLVGLNEGTISHCDFIGDVYVDDIPFAAESKYQGYVGGLVGYNNGVIEYSNITATRVYSYTRNYVGVIIGAFVGDGDFSLVVDCTENVDYLNYDRISYIEWGTCSINRNIGISSGNPIPTPHDHEFYFDVDTPVCGQKRHTVCVCDCGISVAVDSWTDDYYNTTHRYNVTIIEPTCTEDGTSTKICENCSHTIVDTIPATGHKTSIPYLKITNDSKYPFNIDNNIISSTNTAYSTTSSLTLEVLEDHTFSCQYYLSSYNYYCTLYIYLNGTRVDYTNSSTNYNKNLTVKRGDIITIKFTCEASTSTVYTGYVIINSTMEEKVPFDCDEPAICEWCNSEIAPELIVHTWDDGVIFEVPTHLNEGKRIFTCKCGAKKIELIEKLSEHIWDEGVVTTAPTHTTEGVKTYTCECGKTYIEAIAKLTEHVWNEGVVTTTPTHTTEGVKTYTCECGESYTEKIAKLTEHVWNNGVITRAPTCVLEGVKTYTCPCGESYTEAVNVIDHYILVSAVTTLTAISLENSSSYPFTNSNDTYTSTNKVASSTSTFYIRAQYDCTLTIEYGVSSESNYDWLTIYKNTTQQDRISGEVSGKTITISLVAGEYIKITYSKDGSVDRNSDQGYFKIISGSQIVIENTERVSAESQNASCTHAVICDGCGTEIKPIIQHIWDTGVITTQPTHITVGEKKFTCTDCGLNKYEVVEKISVHEWDSGVVTTIPTHMVNGVKTFCCQCGATYSIAIEKIAEHDYKTQIVVDPTCTAEGYTNYICECGDSYVSDYVSIINHSYGDWYAINSPTCTETGVDEHKCVYCQYTETKVVDALGHDHSVWVTEYPTCTKKGYKYSKCTRCDNTEKEVLYALEHNIQNEKCVSCGIETVIIESTHNYKNSINEEYIISKENAVKIMLTFSAETRTEDYFDTISIYDGNNNLFGKYSGTELSSKSLTIDGSFVKIVLSSDSTVNYYGFKANVFVVYSACEHIDAEWITDQEATLIHIGHKNLSCKECNAIIGEGDIPKVNIDEVSEKDYKYISDVYTGKVTTSNNIEFCDINGDGKFDIRDIIAIKEILNSL